MRTSPKLLMWIVGLTLIVSTSHGAAQPPAAPVPAVAVDAVTAIVAAYHSHSVVTLPDWHGDHRLLEFILTLLRDPRLPAVVDDIVVENTNARYQAVLDRYVRGEDVPLADVLAIWEDTTVQPAQLSEVPALYRTVREVNAGLPRDQQLRILLGEPPIDSKFGTRRPNQQRLEMRDSHPAALIQVEVLAKGRTALVIYGQMHAQRRNLLTNFDMTHWLAQTIVSNVERATPTPVFTIWNGDDKLPTLQPSVASWRTPGLALLRGTVLGAADFAAYTTAERRMAIRGDDLVPIPKEEWRVLPMEEQFDARVVPRACFTVTFATLKRVSRGRNEEQPTVHNALGA